MQTHVSDMATV